MTFEAYVEALGAALLRLAYLLTGHAQDAEDLVQSALLDALRHWRRVAASASPDAYVKKILVNRHLTNRRRRWHGERPTDFADPDAPHVPVLPRSDLEDRETFHEQLGHLPPRGRAVLVLRYYEDLADEQIAELLGIAASSVRATASRALAALRAQADTSEERR